MKLFLSEMASTPEPGSQEHESVLAQLQQKQQTQKNRKQNLEKPGQTTKKKEMETCCPYHDDRHPSMKVDMRLHCFECQAGESVIDFTAALYGLSVKEAAEKLASDFNVSYDRRGKTAQGKAGRAEMLPCLFRLPSFVKAVETGICAKSG